MSGVLIRLIKFAGPILLLIGVGSFLFSNHSVRAQVTESSPSPSPLPTLETGLPRIPGTTEGTGTHFEITDSQYLNITLDSTETVKVRLESIPEMVTLRIESASTATSTQLTLSGFPQNTTFYKYEDDYHNEVAFTTNANGSYSYTQDISKPHFVFIQPRKSTKFIKDDATGGDCTTIGTWNSATKTCTLTTDVFETIQIDSDGVTLDGSGHSLTGTKTGNGVYVPGRVGVTIKNLNISNFAFGLVLQPVDFSMRNMRNSVTSNRVSSSGFGIILNEASNNNLINNIVSNNGIGIYLSAADNNTLSNNEVTNSTSGGQGGILFGNSPSQNYLNNNVSSNNAGPGIRINGPSNTLDGNITKFNSQDGISVEFAPNSTVINNNSSNNAWRGIYLNSSGSSNVNNNIVNGNNIHGMFLAHSSGVIGKNNRVSINNQVGIYIYGSTGELSGNSVSNNYYGFYLQFSTQRSVFNNTIENNTFGIFTDSSAQSQIYNNNFINNITQAQRGNFLPPGDVFNLSAPLGGNYWSNYDTSAEGCNNINNDNFCDTPYTFIGGKDELPWTKQDGWLALPPPDADGDSIPDSQDACPNQAETVNGFQDQDGCPEPDLSIIKSDSPDPVASGDFINYSLNIANNGRLTALDVVLKDYLPADFNVISVTPSQGTCSDITPPELICEPGTINPGGNAQITIKARTQFVLKDTQECDKASVTTSSEDSNLSNNEVVECATVVPVYIATGDSYADGDDLGPNLEPDQTRAYPARLRFQHLLTLANYDPTNISKSGTTAGDYPGQIVPIIQGPKRPALITITIGANETLRLLKEALSDCKILNKLPTTAAKAAIPACIAGVIGATGNIYAESVKNSITSALEAFVTSPHTRNSLIVVTNYPNPCPQVFAFYEVCDLLMLKFINNPISEAFLTFWQAHPADRERLILVDDVYDQFKNHEVASSSPWIIEITDISGLPVPFGVHPNDLGHQCISNLIWESIKLQLGSSEPLVTDPCQD